MTSEVADKRMIRPTVIDLVLDGVAPRSQTSKAYEIIRAAILNGSLLPERKLKIQDLALELDVSPSAVREALSRLVPEQLVVSREQRGFVVAPLSLEDLADLTDLRCEIEAIAVRRSLALGDVNWEANLLAAEYRMRNHSAALDGDEARQAWAQSHAAFHAALISACGSPRLLALHARLYEQSERYRGLMFNFETDRDLVDEHHKIVEHALARDADALVKEVTNHLRLTTELIHQTFGNSGKSDD